jgi:hypothetical protein
VFWDSLLCESLAAGRMLYGRPVVVDCETRGSLMASLGRVSGTAKEGKKLMGSYPGKEPPLPEGFSSIFIIGIPSAIAKAQHSTAQHSTAQHSTAQRSIAQHSIAQHSIA